MTEHNNTDVEVDGEYPAGSGGFVALAVLAAAIGAGAAVLLAPEEGAKTRKRVASKLRRVGGDTAETVTRLQREIRRRRNQTRREKRIIAVAGLLVGAGIAALVAPGGAEVRTRLSGTLGRIKVGAVDRIDRLRQRPSDTEVASEEDREVRSVQELGRDSNTVF
jgi:hypothetical protein